nr:response regulator [uncultured Dyadobacter sp.]
MDDNQKFRENEPAAKDQSGAGAVSPQHSGWDSIAFTDLIENIPFPVAMFDQELCMLAASNIWIKAGKLTDSDWRGKPLNDVCHDVGLWKQKHLLALKGSSLKGEEQECRIPVYETPQYVNWQIRPWRKSDGSIGGTVMSVQNVTESVLSRLSLQKALQVEEEAKRIKSRFLSNISHELRTPLNGILGFTNLAIDEETTGVRKHYLEIVKGSASKLLNIVNNVLDFSEIESGSVSLELQRKPLCEIVRETVDVACAAIQRKGLDLLVRFHYQRPVWIYIDAVRVKQILFILLENAAKFTRQGEIELSVAVTHLDLQNETGVLEFSIRDTGIGIAEAEKERIMDAFTQAEPPLTKRHEGAGLGLAISSELLKMMDSKFDVVSYPGQGSTFSFKLEPRIQVAEVNTPIKLDFIKRVLIVDDNQTTREIIEEILSFHQVTCVHANNRAEALAMVGSGALCDAVLLEHNADQMDIDVFSNTLMNCMNDPAPGIIVMYTLAEDVAALRDQSALYVRSFIQKPVRYQDLILAMSDLYAGRREERLPGSPTDVFELRQNSGLSMSILLVEDNHVNMLLLRTVLRRLLPDGLLIEAGNGLAAVNICKQKLPDIIFMDVQMPVMNGLDATKAIRQIAHAENLPIVALTAGNEKGARDNCLAAGMDEFLTKPYTPKDLMKVLQKFAFM